MPNAVSLCISITTPLHHLLIFENDLNLARGDSSVKEEEIKALEKELQDLKEKLE